MTMSASGARGPQESTPLMGGTRSRWQRSSFVPPWWLILIVPVLVLFVFVLAFFWFRPRCYYEDDYYYYSPFFGHQSRHYHYHTHYHYHDHQSYHSRRSYHSHHRALWFFRRTCPPPYEVVLSSSHHQIHGSDGSKEVPVSFRGDSEGSSYQFPSSFVFGAATSSYQIEGGYNEGGRGPTVWDTFCQIDGAILDGSNGNVACNHYHLWKSDVQLMKSLNLQAYRFSIAWSRIMPTGTYPVNQAGIDFYSHLIDELLAHGIQPWVTLFHWDLPQPLMDSYGGWLDQEQSVRDFTEYARVCFEAFGDRVHHWITTNEIWTVAVNGHATGIHAPGHQSPTEPYQVAHSLLLAHASAVHVYRTEFLGTGLQQGIIGLANCGDFRYPLTDQPADWEAAERAMLFQLGWLTDPIFLGDYPAAMKERLGDRLPTWSSEEIDLVYGSADFVGLNYYSAALASTPPEEYSWQGYWADMFVTTQPNPEWEQNDMGWSMVPDGLEEILLWMSDRYGKPRIVITENGSAEHEPDLITAQRDERRRAFFEGHLRACARAIENTNVQLGGYFAWSLMDNFEWQLGYQKRFGICRVDYETQERTPKSSALWYNTTIVERGRNIVRQPVRDWFPVKSNNDRRRSLAKRTVATVPRSLPKRVLLGYGSDIDQVRKAVYKGTNVVIWSFVDIRVHSSSSDPAPKTRVSTELNLTAVTKLIHELDKNGFSHVIHMMSVGGWNGDHLDPRLTADEWFDGFALHLGSIFDGIDWDLEGNDDLESQFNAFSMETLDKVGAISKQAKEAGFFVSMAPPQSYLDIDGTGGFSRMVNLTDPFRNWHHDFSHYGRNVYAYLLAEYGDSIDLISIQFYESFSRGADAVYIKGIQPAEYLANYMYTLHAMNYSFFVKFTDDPKTSHLGDRLVPLPLSKLVLGLANGWALAAKPHGKVFFVRPQEMEEMWQFLNEQNSLPRGFMFWTIDEEGYGDLDFAQGLTQLIHSTLSAEEQES